MEGMAGDAKFCWWSGRQTLQDCLLSVSPAWVSTKVAVRQITKCVPLQKNARALFHVHGIYVGQFSILLFSTNFFHICHPKPTKTYHENLRNRLIILYTSQSPRWDPPATVALWLPESSCWRSAQMPPSRWVHGVSTQPSSDGNRWPGRIEPTVTTADAVLKASIMDIITWRSEIIGRIIVAYTYTIKTNIVMVYFLLDQINTTRVR